jgi:hypothetical protein
VRILLIGEYRHPWHEITWARALSNLGHEVGQLEAQVGGNSLNKRVQARLAWGPAIEELNHNILLKTVRFNPHVVLAYRALLLKAETVAEIRKRTSAITVCYQNDNIFGPLKNKAYWRLFREAIPEFDRHLVFRRSDVPLYVASGGRSVHLLRHHFVPWIHSCRNADIGAGRTVQIGFYGHCEQDRRIIELDHLMRTVPATYEIRGSGWARESKGRPWEKMDTRPVFMNDYVEALNRTAIALCFMSTLNEDQYTTRVFEIPACGSLLLSQRTEEMQTLFEEGKEAMYFGSPEELAETASRLVLDGAMRRSITLAGLRRASVSGYDIESRMKEWLSYV